MTTKEVSNEIDDAKDEMNFLVSVDTFICSFREYVHVNSEREGMAAFSDFIQVYNAKPGETIYFGMSTPVKVIDESDKKALTERLEEMVNEYFTNKDSADEINSLILTHSLLLEDDVKGKDDIALGSKEYFAEFPFNNLILFTCALEELLKGK